MKLDPKQNKRFGELKTPLGKDVLVLGRFDGSEGVNELFEYRIEAYSEKENIDFDKAMGKNCSVSLKGFGAKREFSGVLVEAQWVGMYDRYYTYQLVLRPWFWLLTRTTDCRIFHEKSWLDVIKQVLGEYGFAKFEAKTTANYATQEYIVQYRESDYQFICRLMEHCGIYYYFEHSGNDHKMILADAKSSHKPKAGGANVNFRPLEHQNRRNEEHFYHWQPVRKFQTGRVVLNDYDYLKPATSLKADADASSKYTNAKLEMYDYPGKYVEKSDGTDYAKVRLQAEQANDSRCQASGDVPSCTPGSLINLKEHPTGAQNKEYLTLGVSHSYAGDPFVSSASTGGEEIYSANYEFLPSSIPFRAQPLTPKSIIHGPQTAKVVGSGEIDVDEHGRILVQFHWDRDKDKSRRVRVSQIWSGKKWGGIVIPRVGQEVVVEFVEGDPDRPLVTGTVYNGDNKVPYDLPGEKNVAGWKSDSTEGGGGFNEFVFDDTKGAELIRVHGQKDLNSIVENDEVYETGNDESRKVGNDRSEKIGNNFSQHVGKVKTVEANEKIELIVGQSKIIMEPAKITIKSTAIEITASATLDAKGLMTTVKGTANLVLQGGLVKIN